MTDEYGELAFDIGAAYRDIEGLVVEYVGPALMAGDRVHLFRYLAPMTSSDDLLDREFHPHKLYARADFEIGETLDLVSDEVAAELRRLIDDSDE